jgi:hypothetical protein
MNYSLYLQQAGEDDAIERFPKPEHQMTVGRIAKLLATLKGSEEDIPKHGTQFLTGATNDVIPYCVS